MKRIDLIDLPFLGRKNELKWLDDKLDSAFANQGSCLLVTGEPGMGKSRLVAEFLARMRKGTVALPTAVPAGTPDVRDLVAETLRVYVRGAAPLSRVITRVIEPALYLEFKRAVPELDTRYPFEIDAADPAAERPDLRELFFRFLRRLSATAPVVLTINGFERLGKGGRGLIEYLLPHISSIPLLLILSGQDDPGARQWLERLGPAPIERRALDRLTGEDISSINRLMFKNTLDHDFLDWIAGKTGGIPLFLKEFLYALFERGVVYYESEHDAWRVIDSYPRMKMPERIDDMIRERLGKLSRPERDFLVTAAVLGGEFDTRSPLFRTAERSVPVLVRAGFIRPKDGHYAFANPLIRDLLYAGAAPDEKRELHLTCAGYFETARNEEKAAEHCLAAGIENKRVLELLIAASGKSKERGAYSRSAEFLERALGIARALKRYPLSGFRAIYEGLIDRLFLAEQYGRVNDLAPAVEKMFVRRSRLPADPSLAAFYSRLIQSLLHLGKYREALSAARAALAGLDKAGVGDGDETRIEIAAYQAFLYKNLGQVDKALSLALRLQDKCGSSASALNRYNLCKLLGSLYAETRDFRRSIEFRERALAAAKQTGIEHLIAAAQGNLGVSLTSAGQLTRGMEFMRMYQDYNVSAGRTRAEIVSYIHMAQIYFNQGYLDRAEAEYKKGIARAAQRGVSLREAVCELHYRYGTCLVMMEKYPAARQHLEQSLAMAREMNNPASALYALLNLGFLHAALGDKAGLTRTVRAIKTGFPGKYEAETSFVVLEGFRAISAGQTSAGLARIDRALSAMDPQVTSGRFRLLYLCASCLGKSKKLTRESERFLGQAAAVAEKYQMTGWLEKLSPSRRETGVEPLRLYCLGSLRIEHPVKGLVDLDQLQRVKPSQLLTILACGALTRTRYTRERIGSLLWPDLSTAKMVNNFHVCLSRLKDQIGADHVSHAAGVYRLENAWFDAEEFKGRLRKADALAREGRIHLAEPAYEEAFELYADDFLEDVFDPWVDEIRGELRELRNRRLLALGEIYIQKLKLDPAISAGQEILKNDVLNEEGHRFLIKCYLAAGEKARAVNQYKKCVELYRRELDCEPSDETLKLYRKLK